VSARALRFPPVASALRRARAEVRAQAVRLGAPDATCDAVSLVVDELINNAIEHGASYRTTMQDLSVAVGAEDGRLMLEFVDPEMPEVQVRELARALGDAAGGMPSLDSERGRGLFLISVYMEELRVAVAPGGGLHLQGRMAAS
jgi:anti-sigma regulatory factor (Ser/Thr protein kinase)